MPTLSAFSYTFIHCQHLIHHIQLPISSKFISYLVNALHYPNPVIHILMHIFHLIHHVLILVDLSTSNNLHMSSYCVGFSPLFSPYITRVRILLDAFYFQHSHVFLSRQMLSTSHKPNELILVDTPPPKQCIIISMVDAFHFLRTKYSHPGGSPLHSNAHTLCIFIYFYTLSTSHTPHPTSHIVQIHLVSG